MVVRIGDWADAAGLCQKEDMMLRVVYNSVKERGEGWKEGTSVSIRLMIENPLVDEWDMDISPSRNVGQNQSGSLGYSQIAKLEEVAW